MTMEFGIFGGAVRGRTTNDSTSYVDFVDLCLEAEQLGFYAKPKLLIVDELGYLPFEKQTANLFFQLVAARYNRGAIVVTSNVAFDGWGTLFGNDVIASAILDRLLHQSEIFAISGPSYRLKDKRAAGPIAPERPL